MGLLSLFLNLKFICCKKTDRIICDIINCFLKMAIIYIFFKKTK